MVVMTEGSPSGEAHECPKCAQPEPEPVAPIVLMAVGGMLLFFGFFFSLVGLMIGGGGFLYAGLGASLIGGLMLVAGWLSRSRHKRRQEEKKVERLEKAHCEYCGSQNRVGDQKCQSCGAPLR